MFQAILGVSEYLYRLRELELMHDGKIPIMVQERANWPKKIGRNELCPCGSGKKYKRYAVHGHTAAELIVERADHTREHMGLTTWADTPEGKIKKSDVTVAKNYLSQDEMKQLNRMVTAYLDFAENMTLRHIPLTMQDWITRYFSNSVSA